MIRVNLEAYSTESVADSEVVLDGYYSLMQRILIQTEFKYFNITTGIEVLDPTTAAGKAPAYIQVASDVINLYAFQTYD